MNCLILYLFILALLINVKVGDPTCPSGYTYLTSLNKCYSFVNVLANQPTAKASCRSKNNGWLATLDSAAKQTVPSTMGTTTDGWIGLYKTAGCVTTGCVMQTNLFWDTGVGVTASTSTYVNFASSNPNVVSDLCFRWV